MIGSHCKQVELKIPLYTKPMVWDKDLTWDGISWKTKYKMSKQTTISTTGGVNTVTGDDTQTSMLDDDKDSQYQTLRSSNW